ncbi:hypothetical protein [Paenibacillus glycinis]|uniref:Uncharacterized protein n=1 Tax=Paenibacillus glycinis TaxID=2697035 RepID=A0ABW9XKT1_9BACL|nr:hypothetical protein [Paenibacillus glycinis]NBD23207.1 hypothetical protein [Paenibacillus glycinis]
MIGYFVIAAIAAYGAWHCARLWRRGKLRESVVLGLVSSVVAAYLLPGVRHLPTAESIHAWLYRPLSDYVIEWLNVSTEVNVP